MEQEVCHRARSYPLQEIMMALVREAGKKGNDMDEFAISLEKDSLRLVGC